MQTFIDTNILYYKFSNKKLPIQIKGRNIVSINALEFLKNIDKEHNNRARYHIPLALLGHVLMYREYIKERNRPFPKHVCDSIKFDFKQDFESYALFNNETITNVINSEMKELFRHSISFMNKEEFKELKSKFWFLIENEVTCHFISDADIELSYELLDSFLKKHMIKKDFKNSWNDLLILSKVINSGGNLISTDKLLNHFAAKEFAASVKRNYDFFEFRFPTTNAKSGNKLTKFESKGYINKGWAYRINKGKAIG